MKIDKIIKITILSISILTVGIYIIGLQNQFSYSSPSDALKLSKKVISTKIHGSKRLGNPNLIESVKVVKDEPNSLEVLITYSYDGKSGKGASTCGDVIKKDMTYSTEWSCKPSILQVGKNTVLYRISLLRDRAKYFTCTDIIRVNMYNKKGVDFLNQLFIYNKSWINGSGFFSEIQKTILDYTICN